ncbi:MAG: flagellar basal body-associated FliL family protein [Victivallales bacterium]|nr:flagellar basal body-associated FliL family protein [Victivallales bacterium]
MADKAKAEARDIEINADKSKPVIIMLIVLAVLVLVFTPIVTLLVLEAFLPKDSVPAEKVSRGTEITLDTFKFNVAHSQGTRFAQVQVVLELSDADMRKYFQPNDTNNPDGMGNKIKSEVLDILSERTLDGLLLKDSRATLRKEIMTKINVILSERKAKGVVTDVYFPSFLVQ